MYWHMANYDYVTLDPVLTELPVTCHPLPVLCTRYWALVMPVYFAMVFVFLIALNVGISLVLTPDLSSMTTIQGEP